YGLETVDVRGNGVEGEAGLRHDHLHLAREPHGPQGRLDDLIRPVADDDVPRLQPVFLCHERLQLRFALRISVDIEECVDYTLDYPWRGRKRVLVRRKEDPTGIGSIESRFRVKGYLPDGWIYGKLQRAFSMALFARLRALFCIVVKSSAERPAPMTIFRASPSVVRSDGE